MAGGVHTHLMTRASRSRATVDPRWSVGMSKELAEGERLSLPIACVAMGMAGMAGTKDRLSDTCARKTSHHSAVTAHKL